MRFLASQTIGASAAIAASLLALLNLACATTRAPSSLLPLPPAADAPVEARETYYQKHRPASIEEVQLRLVDHGVEAPGGYRLLRLQLANGDFVSAHTLLTAVPADSVTAAAVAAAELADAVWMPVGWIGAGAAVAAFVAGGVLLWTMGPVVALVVAGPLVLTAFALSPVAFFANQAGAVERERAFRCFDHDLRVRLDLPPEYPLRPGCTKKQERPL